MRIFTFCFILSLFTFQSTAQEIACDNQQLTDAYNLAVNTVRINVRRGILAAGGDYGGEWTRDIAINSWNGVSMIMPEVAERSLWSVTLNRDTIGHQYWDKILWVLAANNHYNITGDRVFLQQAYDCAVNTMKQLEQTVFDKEYRLFTGPAVMADGIAGYPEPVFDPANQSSYVLDHRNAGAIKCLSTNCVYYGAYLAMIGMAESLNHNPADIKELQTKADMLKSAILKYFYNSKDHKLNYLIDHTGSVDSSQEALGYSFAVIFGITDPDQSSELISSATTSKYGIPSLYPDFPRYSPAKPGRHNNILWPMINGFFAQACVDAGNMTSFMKELDGLTKLALDPDKGNYQFWEIYNPYTGLPDGGYQAAGEGHPDFHWKSCRYQTWSATAYIRMILYGLAGIRLKGDKLHLEPFLPADVHYLKLTGLYFRQSKLDIVLMGAGQKVKSFLLDGVPQASHSINPGLMGNHEVVIEME